jgi:hypothetical protein
MSAIVAVFFGMDEVSREASNSSKVNVRRYFPGVKRKHAAQELYFSGFLADFFAFDGYAMHNVPHPQEAPQRRLEGRTMLVQPIDRQEYTCPVVVRPSRRRQGGSSG